MNGCSRMPDAASSSEAIGALLRPRSIALIGASTDAHRYSGRPLRFLLKHGYEGALYPVNPRYADIGGLPCFPNVASVPGPVDLAVIMVSASHVPSVLEACAAAGVRAALIMSSGFAELGEDGRNLQRRLCDLAAASGMRICGPNSGGIINLRGRVGASLLSCLEMDRLLPGDIALVSQSGTVCNAPFNRAQDRHLGFSSVVSSGNEADLDVADFIEYFAADDATRVILAYVEGIRDGARFLAAAARARREGKPLVVLKVGRHERGRRVVASHTGAVAGSDTAFDAACARSGITRVTDLDEMLDVASVLSRSAAPARRGVAVVAVGSGGAAGLLADMTAEAGLFLPDFAPETKQALARIVSPLCTLGNPIDLAGVSGLASEEPAMLRDALPVIAADPEIGAIIVALPSLPYHAVDIAETLVAFHGAGKTSLVVTWLAGSLSTRGFEMLERGGVPLLRSCGAAVGSIRALLDYYERPRLSDVCAPATAAARDRARTIAAGGAAHLGERETKQWLREYGIPCVPDAVATSPEEAARIADEIGYPVALKIVADGVAHKQAVNGVRLAVADAAAVCVHYRELVSGVAARVPAAVVHGVLVQPMIGEGLDLFLGMFDDAQFGPVVVLGLGGLLAARPGRLGAALAPCAEDEAARMLANSGLAALAEANRDLGLSLEPVTGLVARFSRFAADVAPVVSAIDVNPLRILPYGRGVVVLDAKCYFDSRAGQSGRFALR